ncbi:DUF2705 family protein [Terribacillus saccharophilus]|uniref:DUF2705 family protein n=1 Tax=Terribacillus saccharophilus TaxID=361277 RepID=UPI003D36437F
MIIVVIFAIVGHSIINYKYLSFRYEDYSSAFFLLGIPGETEYTLFIFWYFVFVSISFYFSGEVSELLSGYGKYVIIRNYHKGKWISRRYLLALLRLTIFPLILMLVAFIVSVLSSEEMENYYLTTEIIISFVIYCLVYCNLIFLQLYLEMFITPQIALLIVNIYVIVSVLLGGLIIKFEKGMFLMPILIPNISMSLRRDYIYLTDSISICYLLLIGLTIFFLSYRKFTTKDIL